MKTAIQYLLLIGLLSSPILIRAQKNVSDSLYSLLSKSPDNRQLRKNFINAYRKWSADSAYSYGTRALNKAILKNDRIAIGDWYLFNGGSLDGMGKKNESFEALKEAYSILKSEKDTFNFDDAANSLGNVEIRLLDFKLAKQYLEEANAMREQQRDTVGLAGNNINLGLLYGTMGDYPHALEYYYRALDYARLAEKKDPSYIGKALNNLGSIYMDQKKYKDALSFFRQSLAYKLKLGNKNDIASTYNNIGSNFMEQHEYDSALYYFNMALKLREETKELQKQGIVHNNIGQVFEHQEQYVKAEAEYRKALQLREGVNDKNGIIGSLNSLGMLLCKIKKYTEGLQYLRRSYRMALESEGMTQRFEASISLAKGLQSSGYFEEGLTYAMIALDLKDSILTSEADKNSAEMKARYDMDLSAHELEKIKMKQKEDRITNDAERSRMRTLLLSGGILAFLTILFFVIRVRETRRSRVILQSAYDQIESKNKNITDSIQYAKQIQLAILPERELLKQVFPESFVFYQPKDIVSGDFFWLHPAENKIWFAVADCTGHGVPGAFMSVLGASQLTNAVTELPNETPNSILNKIDRGIQKQLHQDSTGSGSRDGMDIALCCWHPATRTLVYAGANRPAIIHRKNGELEFLKPVKRAIGGIRDGEIPGFVDHEIKIEPGETIFLYSDGYPDQFGGPKGKKFKSSQFKEMLTRMTGADMRSTGIELDKMFNEWKGNLDQVDDVCVLGIRA